MRKLSRTLLFVFFQFIIISSAYAQWKGVTPQQCEPIGKLMSALVDMRREGQNPEVIKGFVSGVFKSLPGSVELTSVLIDKVFSANLLSLDTLARQTLDECTGKIVAAKIVSPENVGAALKGLRRIDDKMTGDRWYRHTSSPTDANSNAFYLYFGRKQGGQFYVMHLVSRYSGSHWLFVKNASSRADGLRINIPQNSTVPGAKWYRDHANGDVWEEYDSELMTSEDITTVRKISESKDVTVRFEGDRYNADRKLTSQQLIAMRQIIQAYETVTGKAWK